MTFSSSDINQLTATPTTALATATKKASLGQADFLKLMTAQMTHQDPSQPMQNGEFITQMAQFGTVSGIQDLQKSFSDFSSSINSSQALQATGLVGREVSVPGTQGLLNSGGSISGDINLPSSATNVHMRITDSTTGALVLDSDMGAHSAGKMPFVWDGTNSNGVPVSPGVYKVEATMNIDGKNTALETDINSRVDSVTMGSGTSPMKVNLTGLDSVDFSQIKQIL
jgi:flagellar basal-body rod modification protein FlgD